MKNKEERKKFIKTKDKTVFIVKYHQDMFLSNCFFDFLSKKKTRVLIITNMNKEKLPASQKHRIDSICVNKKCCKPFEIDPVIFFTDKKFEEFKLIETNAKV